MAKSKPIMSAPYEKAFTRGIRECVDMLGTIEHADRFYLQATHRRGPRQENAVRRALGRVLMRGDAGELDGFCAALTEITACADESGDFYRLFNDYADRRERVAAFLTTRNARLTTAHRQPET